MNLDTVTKRRLRTLGARERRLREQHQQAALDLRAALRDVQGEASLAELAALTGRSRQRVHGLMRAPDVTA